MYGYSGNVQITPKQGDDIGAYLEVPHETTAGGCRHDRTIRRRGVKLLKSVVKSVRV